MNFKLLRLDWITIFNGSILVSEIFKFFFFFLRGLLLQACVELLEEENVQIPSWICFSSVDGENAPSGESFKECLDIINKSKKVNAVGINCAPPHFLESLICKFKEVTFKFTTE